MGARSRRGGTCSPDSHLDLAARERSANLYLPEGVITMLPPEITDHLGLGLQELSPAMSFGFRLERGQVTDIQISPSRVKVTRTTYDAVEDQIEESHFAAIYQITEAYRAARLARDAAHIDLPEVSVKLVDDEVLIRPLPKLRSRQMVTDAMLMAGEAAARFAEAEGISIPYATTGIAGGDSPTPKHVRSLCLSALIQAQHRVLDPGQALWPGIGILCQGYQPPATVRRPSGASTIEGSCARRKAHGQRPGIHAHRRSQRRIQHYSS